MLSRQLLVISEAAIRMHKIDATVGPKLVPDIDWPGIRGIGNFIRHKYDDPYCPASVPPSPPAGCRSGNVFLRRDGAHPFARAKGHRGKTREDSWIAPH